MKATNQGAQKQQADADECNDDERDGPFSRFRPDLRESASTWGTPSTSIIDYYVTEIFQSENLADSDCLPTGLFDHSVRYTRVEDPDMTRVRRLPGSYGLGLEVSHVVGVAPEDAWDLLVDTHRWADWSPLVTSVETTDRRIGSETTGQVRLVGGLWVPFEITGYALEDRRWAWRIGRVPSIDHRVDTLDDDRCRIAFELPAAAAGYVPVCLRALERLEGVLLEDDTG